MKKKKLRILAFSDLHGDEKALAAIARKAKAADVLVCAGDFTVFENHILRIMKKLDSLGKPVILVNGNHEDPFLVDEICRKLRNVKYMHRRILQINDHAFVGHGGEGFDTVSEDFERFAATAIKKMRLLQRQKKKIIFVTHQPPHNTKVDYIWAHHGSKSYSRFIRKVQPVLHVCGHLHETQGKKDRIGRTLVINPGPKGKIVEV